MLGTGSLPGAAAPARARAAVDLCKLPRGLATTGNQPPLDEAFLTEWGDFLQPLGTFTVRVVLIDFPNLPADRSPEEAFAETARAAEWYAASSFGRVDLDFVGGEKWYRMPRNDGDYHPFGDWYLIRDAVQAADPDVDFTGTDLLSLVMPGDGSSGGWAWPSKVPAARPDGHPIGRIHAVGGADFGTGVHELGHNFGLPDLYTRGEFQDPDRSEVGVWDPMAAGARASGDLLAWHKWKLGWLDDDQIVCLNQPGATEIVLNPVEVAGDGTSPPVDGAPDVKALVIRVSGHRAYVVENRQSVANSAHLCQEGVLVYEVDTHLGSRQGPIYVQTDEDDLSARLECGALWNAPRSVADHPLFEDAAEGVSVEVVGGAGETLTVRASRDTTGARTNVTMWFRRGPSAHGRVSSPDAARCVAGARVRIIDRTPAESIDGRPSYATVARGIADGEGRYRIALPKAEPDDIATYIAAVRSRTIGETECFDSIAPRWVSNP